MDSMIAMEREDHDTSTSAVENADGPSSNYQEMTEQEQGVVPTDDAAEITEQVQQGGGPHKAQASARSTVMTMTANVIGGGVLALASGFAESSLIMGIFLTLGSGAMTMMNLYFILSAADALDEYDYSKMLRRGLGDRWTLFALVNLVLYPWGALVAYARIIADAIPPVLINFLGAKEGTFITSDVAWILLGGICFFILSCRRTLSEMTIIAIFGLVTIFFAVLCVIIRFFDGSYRVPGAASLVDPDFKPAYLDVKLFKTIPLLTFSLAVHVNFPSYYQELENRSPQKMMRVVHISHVIILTTYILTGMFGVLTFGNIRIESAKGNILDGYAVTDGLLNVARLAMFIHFSSVFPILLVACRTNVVRLIWGSRWLPMRTIVALTFGIVVLSCVVAAVTPNIETVLSINGSLCGSIIVLVIPSFLYLRVVGAQTEGWMENKWKIGAAGSIVFGIVVGILGLVVTLTSSPSSAPASASNVTNATTTTTAAAALLASSP